MGSSFLGLLIATFSKYICAYKLCKCVFPGIVHRECYLYIASCRPMALFFVPFRASFITGNFHSVILPAVFCLFFFMFFTAATAAAGQV